MFSSSKAMFLAVCALLISAPSSMSAPTSFCRPNFQGQAVQIVNQATASRWAVPLTYASRTILTSNKNSNTTFDLEFTGSPSNDYIIKLHGVSDNSLLVQASKSKIVLGSVLPVNSPSWEITCSKCRSPGTLAESKEIIGSGCYIAQKNLDAYVTVKPANTLALAAGGDFNQAFAFYAL